MKKIYNVLKSKKELVFIGLVAIVFRFGNIDSNPPSLNWDEISHGYNAFSILKSGKDEWGVVFPTIFRAYGDYKLPVYIYSVVPSIALFGLNEFAVRLPSVLAGTGTVIFTYLLVGELFLNTREKKNIQIISSLLMALEPWSLFLSRGAFEANLAQFFVVSGIYYFLKSFRQLDQNQIESKGYLLSSVLLGLSVWTYNSARVFIPLLVFGLGIFYGKEIWQLKKKSIKTFSAVVFIFAFFFLPMFYQLAKPVGNARYAKVQILDAGAINKIIEGRNTFTLSPLLARAVHNKATYFATEFTKNYISHFSPQFLFFDGGDQYQFSVPGHGLLSVVNLPFFYLGFVLFIKNTLLLRNDNLIRRRSNWLIIAWLLIAPIPSSLTREAPHVLRSITFLPIPMIVTAYGVLWSINKLIIRFKIKQSLQFPLSKKTSLLVVYLAFLLPTVIVYHLLYFGDYKNTYSWSWQYGYKEAVMFAKEHYQEYDKIIMTKQYGEPHEFVLFYNAWDPNNYRNDPSLVRFAQSDWFWVDAFDKYVFVNDWEMPTGDDALFITESDTIVKCVSPQVKRILIENTSESLNKCLLITSPENAPDGWSLLDTVYFLSGEKVFEIYEN